METIVMNNEYKCNWACASISLSKRWDLHFGDLYLCDRQIPDGTLKKDYFQEIGNVWGANGAFNNMNNPIKNRTARLIELNKEKRIASLTTGVGEFPNYKDKTLCWIQSVNDNKINIVLDKDIDKFIIFPAWETKELDVIVDKKVVLKFTGTEKSCERYLFGFLYEPATGKLCLDKSNKAIVEYGDKL